MYCIQHCFIGHPSDSTVSEDAWIEPRTVATWHWQSDALTTRLDKTYKDGPLSLIWDLGLADSFWDHVIQISIRQMNFVRIYFLNYEKLKSL